MKSNNLCKLLDIEYPIIQAPMAWVAGAELAAAVSEAGGLGTIGPYTGITRQRDAGDFEVLLQRFREQIRRAKVLTSKPFAANIPVGWGKQRAMTDRMVDIAIEEQLPIAVVSMGASNVYTCQLKDARIKVIHAVGSVKHAKRAEIDRVDAVVCEGYEAGGHLGGEELTTFVLVPQISDAVKIPVIAGGGIIDGRGIAAAFALGAQGVYMGTRFLASTECAVHQAVKEAVVEATDTSTVAFARKTGLSRCLRNEYTKKHMELDAGGASFEELREYERTCPSLGEWRRLPGALMAGNLEDGSVPMGAGAWMISEIIPAGEVVLRIAEEYEQVVKRLSSDQVS